MLKGSKVPVVLFTLDLHINYLIQNEYKDEYLELVNRDFETAQQKKREFHQQVKNSRISPKFFIFRNQSFLKARENVTEDFME